eukprot:TRINITY_DN92396_c0_g1_i1.p1 TRINITY_DN92396_c0_g1~~TRINITY_DN92396_c0_g1_i1.p1  ORF type:complete len:178 (-),score=45.44 TRINITY_DN92396_c0_g1_i1:153-686(-)
MPKVVTMRRMPVFTNMKQTLTDDSFNVFHCKKCSTHLVITDADLAALPKRKTDGALVLDARKYVVQPHTERKEGEQLVRREKGVERQYIHCCKNCKKDVGYTSTPHDATLQLLYLSEQAVEVPWHKKKTPWVCKVCGYVCQDEDSLEAHKKQRQHFEEEAEKEAKDAANGTAPIMVG